MKQITSKNKKDEKILDLFSILDKKEKEKETEKKGNKRKKGI